MPARCPSTRGRWRLRGPAAVAIHDDGDVRRQAVGLDLAGQSRSASRRSRRNPRRASWAKSPFAPRYGNPDVRCVDGDATGGGRRLSRAEATRSVDDLHEIRPCGGAVGARPLARAGRGWPSISSARPPAPGRCRPGSRRWCAPCAAGTRRRRVDLAAHGSVGGARVRRPGRTVEERRPHRGLARRCPAPGTPRSRASPTSRAARRRHGRHVQRAAARARPATDERPRIVAAFQIRSDRPCRGRGSARGSPADASTPSTRDIVRAGARSGPAPARRRRDAVRTSALATCAAGVHAGVGPAGGATRHRRAPRSTASDCFDASLHGPRRRADAASPRRRCRRRPASSDDAHAGRAIHVGLSRAGPRTRLHHRQTLRAQAGRPRAGRWAAPSAAAPGTARRARALPPLRSTIERGADDRGPRRACDLDGLPRRPAGRDDVFDDQDAVSAGRSVKPRRSVSAPSTRSAKMARTPRARADLLADDDAAQRGRQDHGGAQAASRARARAAPRASASAGLHAAPGRTADSRGCAGPRTA